MPDKFPECRIGQHNVAHLLECPNKPTSMLLECLLYSPVEAAGISGGGGVEVGEEDSNKVDLTQQRLQPLPYQ